MRFVVKIGSTLLTNPDNSLNTGFLFQVIQQIAALHRAGHEPVIITSGAVASGRTSITLKKENKNIPYRQVLASVGQTFLLDTYRDNFSKYGIVIGQVLLTMRDFEDHKSFLSTRKTVELMIVNRIVPVVNENDVTTFDQSKFGDNDNLSAHLSSLISAEKLILLTDVEGLYEENPNKNPNAKKMSVVKCITHEIRKMASGKGSQKSLGGMMSKIKAAEYATQAGIDLWIAKGSIPNVIVDLIEGHKAHGTRFERQFTSRESWRKWLQMKQRQGAGLVLDEGACQAILNKGKSLLPSGVIQIQGEFQVGDVVSVFTSHGEKIAFGQINYSSEAVKRIKGHHSDEIESILGYVNTPELMHRDNMVNQIAKS